MVTVSQVASKKGLAHTRRAPKVEILGSFGQSLENRNGCLMLRRSSTLARHHSGQAIWRELWPNAFRGSPPSVVFEQEKQKRPIRAGKRVNGESGVAHRPALRSTAA